MGGFGTRIDGAGGRRGAARGAVSLAASMQTTGTYLTIEIVEISATGARLRGAALPAEGQFVLLRAGPLDLFGEVVWHRGDLCGIHFDEPLDDPCVKRMRRDNRVASINVTSADRQAAEDWASGKAR